MDQDDIIFTPSNSLSFLDDSTNFFESSLLNSQSQFGEDLQILDESLIPLKSSNDLCQKIFVETPIKYINNYRRNRRKPSRSAQTSVDVDWWCRNLKRFPKLSTMAKDFLSQQSTPVASESIFSKAGATITKKRNQMSATTLKQCLCVNSWEHILKLGKFIYPNAVNLNMGSLLNLSRLFLLTTNLLNSYK
ncbi:uncharacterized protein LOC135924487 [Gordionus sp. m RMFG-2023]|uniref:uncharacterized protein LOC135924487 n=1 Tax=Gordionus sp. m RMFG-2023 TaxID=3053472 RepID=UPI0031FD71CD